MPESLSSNGVVDGTEARSRLIHQEILKLVVLIAIASTGFFVTRALAVHNREVSLQDAAAWFALGQRQLQTGNADGAIESFRRATVKNRAEKGYVLALARALALTNQDEAARNALLAVRETAPEDPDVNVQLARLAAGRQDLPDAIRYYHNALYAPWPADQDLARRRVRVELIHVLLAHGQDNRAVSELVALSTDAPDDAASHLEIGSLFSAAGDHTHALDQFQRALQRAPDHPDALAGAGLAAFRLGNYPLARTLLHRAPDAVDGVMATRELVDLVVSRDPMAERIGAVARRRRLVDNLAYAGQRLNACPAPSDLVQSLREELQAFTTRLRPAVLDEETLEAGFDVIYRVEREVARACLPLAPLDRALLLIGQRHGVDPR